jgi:hypothetical protein
VFQRIFFVGFWKAAGSSANVGGALSAMLYPPEFLTYAPHVNRNRIKCIDAFISGPFLN